MMPFGLLFAVFAAASTVAETASADQEVIACLPRTGQTDLFRVNLRTGDTKNLTAALGQGSVLYPALAADGKRLAFVATWGDPAANLYVADADGRNVRRITDRKEGLIGQPAWAPDGKRLAYVRQSPPAPPEIVVVDADGRNEAVVRKGGADPSWSPDGKRIAICTKTKDGFQTAVMNADGSGLTVFPGKGHGLGYSDPAWSPDGKRIAYIDQTVNGAQVFVADPDGENAKQLSNIPSNCSSVVWSPDGKSIVFRATRDPFSGYLRMSADGRKYEELRPLTTDNLLRVGRVCFLPPKKPLPKVCELDVRPAEGDRRVASRSLEHCTTLDQLEQKLGKAAAAEVWKQIDPKSESVVVVGYGEPLCEPAQVTIEIRVADAGGVPAVLFKPRCTPNGLFKHQVGRYGGNRYKVYAVPAGSAVGWDRE